MRPVRAARTATWRTPPPLRRDGSPLHPREPYPYPPPIAVRAPASHRAHLPLPPLPLPAPPAVVPRRLPDASARPPRAPPQPPRRAHPPPPGVRARRAPSRPMRPARRHRRSRPQPRPADLIGPALHPARSAPARHRRRVPWRPAARGARPPRLPHGSGKLHTASAPTAGREPATPRNEALPRPQDRQTRRSHCQRWRAGVDLWDGQLGKRGSARTQRQLAPSRSRRRPASIVETGSQDGPRAPRAVAPPCPGSPHRPRACAPGPGSPGLVRPERRPSPGNHWQRSPRRSQVRLRTLPAGLHGPARAGGGRWHGSRPGRPLCRPIRRNPFLSDGARAMPSRPGRGAKNVP